MFAIRFSKSRRHFLRLTTVGLGSLAISQILSGCAQITTAAFSPTSTPVPARPSATSPAPAATDTANPTVTPTLTPQATPATARVTVSSSPRPEIIRMFPAVPSKVIQTHHSGVWSGKKLEPGALRQMLDASITRLTGIQSARDAWSALFKPGERIAIKVNAFRNSTIWTHPDLVMAVTKSLQDAGIPAENITIFDYQTAELKVAGYPVNTDTSGVRCAGMDANYDKTPSPVLGNDVRLANILKDCDALINIPILKSHMLAGISFAMKNHYGSIYYPDLLHGDNMRGVAALNALPEIKDRTRLIIGDVLSANLRYTSYYPYWSEDWVGDSIFMSFDPVAHDTAGLELLTQELEKSGGDSASLIGMAEPALKYAVELGLGTNDPAHFQLLEQTLS